MSQHVQVQAEERHPLFKREDDQVFSFLDSIPDDFLHLLVDLDTQKRITAVENGIRRRMDPAKDEELQHWFRLLKRVYALTLLVGKCTASIEVAEKNLKIPYHHIPGAMEIGGTYRMHLKILYTELPDTIEKGFLSAPVFALPKTKTWLLGEIADGWSKDNPSDVDQIDCLCFLSMAADGALCGKNDPYAKAFRGIRGGWKEVVKRVRNVLRERAEKYEAKDIALFLKNPFLQKTVFASLWHAYISKMTNYESDCRELREMLR